jgi:DNA-binding NarL/FixJ family response regulator
MAPCHLLFKGPHFLWAFLFQGITMSLQRNEEAQAENKWFQFLTARAEAIDQLMKEGKTPAFIASMMNMTPDIVQGIYDNHQKGK